MADTRDPHSAVLATAGGEGAALNRFVEAALRSAPVVIYAKDTALRFVMSNARHAELLGRTPSEVLGHTDAELFGHEADAVDRESVAVLETGQPAINEFPLTLAEGRRVFHETIFRLVSADGETLGLGGIATDITQRRELEQQLAQRNRQLQAALAELEHAQAVLVEQEKLASLGRLVAGLSHEVNTPLGTVVLATSLVEDGLKLLKQQLVALGVDDAAVLDRIEMVQESAELATGNAERAVRLIRSFRNMAADPDVVVLQETTLSEWLDCAMATLTPLCTGRGDKVSHFCESHRRVEVPSVSLHRILSSLLENACQHQAARGEAVVRVSLLDDDGMVRLHVDDNGPGVPVHLRTQVFEPFFTTRRALGATGLGLSVSQHLVRATLNGTLTVAESPLGGARFTVAWSVDGER